GGGGHGGGEYRDLLPFGRQRPDDVDALDRYQLADLLEADFGVAMRDNLADRRGRDLPGLALHFLGEAESRKQLGADIDAAGAVGIGDRLRRLEGARERIDGADVRPQCAGLDRDADRRAHQVDPAVGDRLALLDQIA